MVLPLNQMLGLISAEPDQRQGSDALMHLATGLRQDRQLAQDQTQFEATERLNRDQLASLNSREAAQLAEQQSYHQGQIGVQQRGLDAEAAQKRTAAIKVFSDAVATGNHAAVKAILPYLKSTGVNAEQLPQEIPPAPGLGLPGMPPPDMSFSFEEANPGEARPMSNRYRLSAGQDQLGEMDLDQISEEQRAQIAPMMATLVQQSAPMDRRARQMAADAVSSVPQLAANPEEALKAVNATAQPQIGQEHADQRALAMSQTRHETGAGSRELRIDALVKSAYDKTLAGQKSVMDAKQIQQRIMDSERSVDLIKQAGGGEATTDQNALAGRVAMQNLIRATIRGVSSDRDLKAYMDAGGKEAQVENWLNQWVAGGALSAAQLHMMQGIASRGARVAKQEQINLARAASAAVRGHPIIQKWSPDMVDAYGHQAEREILGAGTASPVAPGDATGGSVVSSSESRSARGAIAGDLIDPADGWEIMENGEETY